MKIFLKKLFSYILSGLVAIALIGGCIAPAYYSREQDIALSIPEGATAELDGKLLEKRGNTVHTTINRSWNDKEIIVRKEGYRDEKVELKSVKTKDKWANVFGRKKSGLMLFVPIHTAFSAAAAAISPGVAIGLAVDGIDSKNTGEAIIAPIVGAELFASGLIILPFGMAMDLYNIVVGVPSTAIKNPWREYEYEDILKDMEPLEKIKVPTSLDEETFKTY